MTDHTRLREREREEGADGKQRNQSVGNAAEDDEQEGRQTRQA